MSTPATPESPKPAGGAGPAGGKQLGDGGAEPGSGDRPKKSKRGLFGIKLPRKPSSQPAPAPADTTASKERVRAAEAMARKYLDFGADMELNLPAELRNGALQALRESEEMYTAEHDRRVRGWMDRVARHVRRDIRMDSFTRFIVSPSIVRVVQKYPDAFTNL